jgi:HEAT repeat protein
VTALHWNANDAAVNTLTVANDHTFFVGSAQVLVHNDSCPGIEIVHYFTGSRFEAASAARADAVREAGLGSDRVDVLSTSGHIPGRIVGQQSADGLRGFRYDWDEQKGFHVNWWDRTGGKKRDSWRYGANVITGGTYDDFLYFLERGGTRGRWDRRQDFLMGDEINCGTDLAQRGKSVQRLIAALHDQDPSVRIGAVTVLGERKSPEAVPALISLLHGVDGHMRHRVADALGEIGDARAVDPLIPLLHDQDSDLRLYIADALGAIGDARATEPLLRAMAASSPGSFLTEAVIGAIRQLGRPAVPLLIVHLTDPDNKVRATAANLLGLLQDPMAVDALLEAAGDPDAHFRGSVVGALGKFQDQRVLKLLVGALADADSNTRRIAAYELGQHRGTVGFPALERALRDDESYDVRAAAANTLGSLGDERAIGPLLRALHDESWLVQCGAARALGALQAKSAVKPLLGLLQRTPPGGIDESTIRWVVARALGRIGDKRALPALRTMLAEEDQLVTGESVQTAANEAITMIEHDHSD